jgi:hypothetical protein
MKKLLLLIFVWAHAGISFAASLIKYVAASRGRVPLPCRKLEAALPITRTRAPEYTDLPI